MDKKKIARIARHKRIRKKVSGSSSLPRLCVFRSLKNICAQVIDDSRQKTLFSLSTADKVIKKALPYGGNVKAAAVLGREIARLAGERGVKRVIFDRAGYAYHGRIKALAEAAKGAGLNFNSGTPQADKGK